MISPEAPARKWSDTVNCGSSRAEGDALSRPGGGPAGESRSLFVELSREVYGKLLEFEQSLLAGIWRFTGACYKLVTRRRG